MAEDSIRINARLSGEDARHFRELEALEGSATNVIREAIREYHVKRVKPRRSAYEIMTASGFIGCVKSGPADLSTRYKDQLARSLDEKYEAEQRDFAAHLAGRKGKLSEAAPKKRSAAR